MDQKCIREVLMLVDVTGEAKKRITEQLIGRRIDRGVGRNQYSCLATIDILLGFFSSYLSSHQSRFELKPQYIIIAILTAYSCFRLLLGAWNCLRTLVPIPLNKKVRIDNIQRLISLEKGEIFSSTDGRSLLYFSDIANIPLSDFVNRYDTLADGCIHICAYERFGIQLVSIWIMTSSLTRITLYRGSFSPSPCGPRDAV